LKPPATVLKAEVEQNLWEIQKSASKAAQSDRVTHPYRDPKNKLVYLHFIIRVKKNPEQGFDTTRSLSE
jgi:hypothetical protein